MENKILFVYSPHPKFSLISKIQAEIVLDLLGRGKEVIFLGCNKELPICYVAQKHKESQCLKCVYVQNNIRKFILDKRHQDSKISFISYNSDLLQKEEKLQFADLEEIKLIFWKGYNLGWGIVSSLISHHRDHQLNVKKHIKEINKEISVSKFVLDNVESLYKCYQPDEVYIFNGRFSYQYAALSYCVDNNINFSIYEFTARSDRYRVINNNTPHNIENARREIIKAWETELDFKQKNEIGESFFTKTRSGGKNNLDHGYIDYQKKNLLPSTIDFNKEIICIFNSSVDEFASVKGWERKIPLFDSEYEALLTLCQTFENDHNKLFVLRVHPNLKYLDNTQNKEIAKLSKLKNLIIILPESKVDTYALIDSSSVVITFGSTIGVEATYWGKPSILLGHSFYETLDVTYFPKTLEELVGLIKNNTLEPKNKANAVKYGFWWMTLGVDFKIVNDIENNFAVSTTHKLIILIYKIREISPKYIVSKLFSKQFYLKLLDKNFRKTIKAEISNWNK